MDRAARPHGPAADPARIQPDIGPVEIEDWLDDREFDREAENLRRLGADEEILVELQINEFSEASWMPLAQELARYGIAVMRAWIRRGTIYEKVRGRTKFRVETIEGWPREDEAIADIASDTVMSALAYFRTQILMAGRWDPRRGASLRTYFIGQCLFQFPNHYRKHRDRELGRRHNEIAVGGDAEFTALMGSIRSTEHTVIARSELADVLASISNERLRAALVLKYRDGLSYQEVADRLAMRSPKQVENMITYFQRANRRTA
jgi:DNA-directed RNA polymerase specialized sigma24 family protein